MREPTDGIFVNGNPAGGTIVRAEFLNAVLGELKAIIELEGEELLTAGALPADHHQIADLLEVNWARVRESYPSTAPNNAVLIDPAALRDGEWPFRIFRDGEWEIPDMPIAPSAGGDGGENGENDDTFDDAAHGQRGGGDLHALATATTAGFLSPAGFLLLQSLSDEVSNLFESDWFDVAEQTAISVEHGLNTEPAFTQVFFRANDASSDRLIVQSFFNTSQQFCGCSVNTNSETVLLRTGQRVFAGRTSSGYTQFSSGQYKVVCRG